MEIKEVNKILREAKGLSEAEEVSLKSLPKDMQSKINGVLSAMRTKTYLEKVHKGIHGVVATYRVAHKGPPTWGPGTLKEIIGLGIRWFSGGIKKDEFSVGF